MSNLNKLIKAIKLRDVNQVRTILDDDGKLVHAYDETGATALHYATFGGLAKSSNCCSTEAQKSDRKSTRLNSSHSQISYAVFCLKKKKQLHPLPPSPAPHASSTHDRVQTSPQQ